jgi:hypothetical protein
VFPVGKAVNIRSPVQLSAEGITLSPGCGRFELIRGWILMVLSVDHGLPFASGDGDIF